MLKDQLSKQVAGFSPTTGFSHPNRNILLTLKKKAAGGYRFDLRDISLRLSKTKRAILGIYLEDSGLAWPGEGGRGGLFLAMG